MGRREAEARRGERRPDGEEVVRRASLSVTGGLLVTLRWERANEGAFRHVPKLAGRPDGEEVVRRASPSVTGGLQATLCCEQANEGACRHAPRSTTFVCDGR